MNQPAACALKILIRQRLSGKGFNLHQLFINSENGIRLNALRPAAGENRLK